MERIDDQTRHESGPLRPALEAGEARFRVLIEAGADGLIVVRRDGSIRFANPAACALLGRKAEDLVGQPFGVPVVPGETTEIDIPWGGDVRVAEMRAAAVDWRGEPAYLAALRDVTERKRLEDELKRQAEQLREADRRKDEFLAMLAHELRNPLAPVLNAARVLRLRGDDPAARARMVEIVEAQVGHLARLIDDLLDVSRITRGKIALRKEPVDLSAAVVRAVEAVRPLIDRHGHALTLTLPASRLTLEADPTRLEQVLVNLLTNAAKYSEPGGRITVEAARDGDHAALAVRDEGIGIAPEMLPRVFDLFAQDGRGLDRSQGGLGIGLTLVKSLVELHGGVVEARSEGPGRGSEFVVRLPLPPPPASAALPDGRPTGTPALGPARILLVDDNADAAETLAALLRLWGHEVRVARDGPSALELAPSYRPDVGLLDIGLPGLDGYELARRLRDLPGLGGVALAAVTGYAGEEDRRRARAAGFDAHLAKPVDVPTLERLLARPGPLRRIVDPGH